jgi:hypothetical protein
MVRPPNGKLPSLPLTKVCNIVSEPAPKELAASPTVTAATANALLMAVQDLP